jgi:hypothetical protein
VKPDLVAFGGSSKEYFHVVNPIDGTMSPTQGTSFAAPYVLRKAVGVKAFLGDSVNAIAIKALLIHSASPNDHDKIDVGWGKVPEELESIIQSRDGVAKILYKGELDPGKYLRLPLPIPSMGITGKVNIRATCCFSAPTNPEDASMYTKAGVEILWRPKKGGKTESFFQQRKIATEAELRSDAGKWESVLHAEKGKLGSSLDEPEFEVHYMARESGADISSQKADVIKYAFVVTLEAPKHPDIFSDILSSYSEILEEIRPRIRSEVLVKT